MNKETKKLITAGMLSDVLGKHVVIFTPIYDGNAYEIISHPSGKTRGHTTKRNLSSYELKDKLEEWFTDEIERNFGLCSHKNFYCSSDSRDWYCGFMKIPTTYGDSCTFEDLEKGKTKLEALLKLYHAVKAEQ